LALFTIDVSIGWIHGKQEETAMAEQQERLRQQVGEYRLFQQLGRGSFGAVYLGEHLHDHSQAAVKLLRLQLTSREDLKDFLNEARTMMRLRHPHIVPLLDFGLTRDDIPYLRKRQ
jgi:serine/threonine protein kinase